MDIDFEVVTGRLIWKTYTAVEAMPTAKQVELIDKHNFVKVVLDENSETFVMHVATLEVPDAIPIHLSQTAQIAICNETSPLLKF